ncbi:MAG: hypothetical protein KC503_44095, partial [Myxococcales bacterium]|nr:hypothetical protein [Myxococcales bacterium]
MRAFLSLSILLVTTPLHAAPMRAVLRRAVAADDALLARVEGQTVDLATERMIHRGTLAPTLGAQLREARALSKRYSARVVIWFRHTARALVVHVAVPADGSALVRRVALGERGAAARSAAAEAAAL